MTIKLQTINNILRPFGLIVIVAMVVDMDDDWVGSTWTTLRVARRSTWLLEMAS